MVKRMTPYRSELYFQRELYNYKKIFVYGLIVYVTICGACLVIDSRIKNSTHITNTTTNIESLVTQESTFSK